MIMNHWKVLESIDKKDFNREKSKKKSISLDNSKIENKKGYKGYWFDDNGTQGICASSDCFEVLSENSEEDTIKRRLSSVQEKDVLDAVEKLSDKDDICYNDWEAIECNSPTTLLTPSGDVLNATDYDTHSNFMYAVFNQISDIEDYDYMDNSEAYDYVIEYLGFITLNTGDGFSDDRCKVVIDSRPTSKQINLLREWVEKRIEEEKPIIVFVRHRLKTYDLADENYDAGMIIKAIQRSFISGFLETLNKEELRDKIKKIIEVKIVEVNKELDSDGFAVEYIEDYEFDSADKDDWIGIFCSELQDNASVFPISINIDLLIKECLDDAGVIDDLNYHIEKSLWHEVGHGIFGYCTDILYLDDLNEEDVVEEYASYQMGDENKSELIKILAEWNDEVNSVNES